MKKMLAKEVQVTFIDLKTCGRVDCEAMRDVLKIYGVCKVNRWSESKRSE